MEEKSEWDDIIREAHVSSIDSGVPAIDMEDGYVIYSTAYLTTLRFGQLKALDAGAGVGFSTMWLARALIESGVSGTIYAVERTAQRYMKLRGLIRRHRLGQLIVPVNEDALEYANKLEGLNFVFLDIDKDSYLEFFRLIKDRVAIGGLLLAHNVRHPWGAIRSFLKETSKDGWKTTRVPTSEGISISLKTA